jgi:ADP-ribosylglycohydrolase
VPTLIPPAAIVNSAIWAAYGDALGFISEGVDDRGLSRRLTGQDFDTRDWVRKVSRSSPDIAIPAGTYSDDTQLRLATGRAIRSDGAFDVESFSQFELPAWLDFHLGAGLGTLSAANRLRSGTSWNTLVAGDKDGRYVKGGGNGAAMRIQPHVWVARTGNDNYLIDVIINTACTHGHPKAFVGALVHAIMLRDVLERQNMPDLDETVRIVDKIDSLVSFFEASSQFGTAWLTQWDRSTASSFVTEWRSACKEVRECIDAIPRRAHESSPAGVYQEYLQSVGLMVESERGVATKTAVAAFAAITIHHEMSVSTILKLIASTVRSDTDTIATMAGALLGAFRPDECNSQVLDRQYIASEAKRAASIAHNSPGVGQFRYSKTKPRGNELAVGGLGVASPISERMGRPGAKEAYQWASLQFGQTILLRIPQLTRDGPNLFEVSGTSTLDDAEPKRAQEGRARNPSSIAMTLAQSGFDAQKIGKYLLNCARYPYGEGLAAAISYELVRLYRDRPREGVESGSIQVESTPPELQPKPRANHELRAAIQLQLNASKDRGGYRVQGTLANYGRRSATDIVVTIGSNGTGLRLEIASLDVDASQEIETTTDVPIGNGAPVQVSFRSDGVALQQRGRFEQAFGHESTYLLKGLDLAQMS